MSSINEKTHWKKLTNPNYLGDYALPVGKDLIAVIDYVAEENVTGIGGKTECEVVLHFRGGIKPMILNKTNLKTIQSLCKSPYIEDWRGCAIQIYYDETVKFGRETVGGLRIRPFVPEIKKFNLICAECGKKITEASGKSPNQIAEYTYRKYGRELCAECAAKVRAELEKRKAPDPFADKED